MRGYLRVFALSIVMAAPLLAPTGLVHSQVGTDALEACEGFAFSTEEGTSFDFP